MTKMRHTCRGSVLILVLWLLMILGVLGITYSASVKTQYDSFQMTRGRKEAYWAARAGVEKAVALLAAVDLNALSPSDPLFSDETQFKDQQIGAARFSLVVDPVESNESARFGIGDTASRLNVNNATEEMLMKMTGMTHDMAQSVIDWRDGDSDPQEAGAEIDYYRGLREPYVPRNGALLSMRELIRVRGWADVFRAAAPDPYEKFAPNPPPQPEIDPIEARLILGRMTAWSAERDIAPDGQKKINLQSATESELSQRMGLTSDEAKAVVAYQSNLGSPLSLIDVPPAKEENQGSGSGSQSGNSSSSQGNSGGRIFSIERVGEIIDFASHQGGGQQQQSNQQSNQQQGNQQQGNQQQQNQNQQSQNQQNNQQSGDSSQSGSSSASNSTMVGSGSGGGAQAGRININTASHEVLMLIPGMSDDLALQIEQRRAGKGRIDRAGLIASLGADESQFKQVWPWLTADTHRFYVKAIGNEPSSGAVATIEAVVSVEENSVDVIYWSEN